MDFFNKAMEQAKALQQIAVEAAQKSYDQAQPLVREGVARAQELQKTIVEQTPGLTAAAQQQANAALEHAGAFIATGKTVLEAGATQAQAHMTIFAEQAKKAADATMTAAQSAVNRQSQTATPGASSGTTPGAESPRPPGA